jgi:hypothetical protein
VALNKNENTHFSMERRMSHELGTSFFVHKRIISAVKRVESVGDRMPYIILRCHWSHIIVLSIQCPNRG